MALTQRTGCVREVGDRIWDRKGGHVQIRWRHQGKYSLQAQTIGRAVSIRAVGVEEAHKPKRLRGEYQTLTV
jgi:hypothetical protein